MSSGDADVSLIGQFGVGFYSAFLVANKAQLQTSSTEAPTSNPWIYDDLWVWNSLEPQNYM